MEIPEKYIMKISGSVVEYENDYRYSTKIKEKIFGSQIGSVVPLSFNYDHYNRPLCLLGVAKLKTDEKGISADCYICDVLNGRMVKELIDSGTPFELGIYANNIESTTHGDETIITKGTIKEVSIVPVENVIYPIEIDKENKNDNSKV